MACLATAYSVDASQLKGTVLSAFTELELEYLGSQPLMRIATASLSGAPDIAVVTFDVDGDDIVSGGFDIARTVRFRNIGDNPRATLVIDDLKSVDPWTPRFVKIRGTASIEEHDGGLQFRISPQRIWTFGLGPASVPGLHGIQRRDVG